ncbi:hypothetical protein CMI47_13620 [Candidatus Pacearchaeota archaeon]|nr:hypothetical protein [Candidatus Pacearchaeota archaeon]|tara:strand:+ start:581 stop:979 length:399 start_codon:yes stop_codon:yes gene_type:complete
MADQTPLRAIFDDSGKVTGLGQYQLSDTIGVVDGGTGTTTLTIGNIIIGNGVDAMQSVPRGSILGADNTVIVTNGANSVVGNDVTIQFNSSSIDINETSGRLSITRLRDPSSDEWNTEVFAAIDANPNEESF